MKRVGKNYGVSCGTVSNYLRHFLYILYDTLDAAFPGLVSKPSSDEFYITQIDHTISYLRYIVDGNKNRRTGLCNNGIQGRAYDMYNKAYSFSIIVFCDQG